MEKTVDVIPILLFVVFSLTAVEKHLWSWRDTWRSGPAASPHTWLCGQLLMLLFVFSLESCWGAPMVTERHLKRWSSFRSPSLALWTTTPSQFRSALSETKQEKNMPTLCFATSAPFCRIRSLWVSRIHNYLYGSGSFYQIRKKLIKTLICTVLWLLKNFLSLKTGVDVSWESDKQKKSCCHLENPGFRIRIDLMRIRIRIRIQHFFLLRIRIPDPDPVFDDLKLKKIYN